MSNLLEGSEQLERELTPERILAPATGSFALHGALAAAILLYAYIGGFFHHNNWGDAGTGGAIQVNLVSNALPLPADQKPNDNVLATETPSQAPAPPAPKAQQAVEDKAIPIPDKITAKQKEKSEPKTQLHQPPPKQDNRAHFGEQAATSMPRATQSQTSSTGPVSVSEGDFGSRFGWYVAVIQRKASENWNRPEVDPRTPKGSRVYLTFTIRKDGSPTDVKIDRSSGSPTLDASGRRAVQRVDTFGSLPPGYNGSSISVSYYFEY